MTLRHPLVPSNEAKTVRFCEKVAEDTLAHRASAASPRPMDLATSLALTNAEKSKHQTYQVLMKMVRYEHSRLAIPPLLPPIWPSIKACLHCVIRSVQIFAL